MLTADNRFKLESEIACLQGDVDQIRRQYEVAVSGRLHAIAERKRLLNTSIPIACLPTEILSEIFQHFQYVAWDHLYQPSPWMKITHVCHHWRSIALQCLRLWRHVQVGCYPEAVEEMLARSGHLPLHIMQPFDQDLYVVVGTIREPDNRPAQALSLVLQQLPRIKSMDLMCRQSVYQAAQLTSFPIHHPPYPLRSLSLCNVQWSTDGLPGFLDFPFPFLTQLKLTGWDHLWETFGAFLQSSGSKLSSLELESTKADLIGLLDVLRCVPNLKFLYLSEAFRDDEGLMVSADIPVRLASLLELHLSNNFSFEYLTFLSHISLSPDTKIRIELAHLDEAAPGLGHSMSMQPSDAKLSGSIPPITSWVVSCPPDQEHLIVVSGYRTTLDIHQLSPTTPTPIVWAAIDFRAVPTDHVQELFASLGSSKVEALYLGYFEYIQLDLSMWFGFLESTPNLGTMVISGRDGLERMTKILLYPRYFRGKNKEKTPTLLPNLKTLAFRDVVFAPRKTTAFCKALKTRKSLDWPLERLLFSGCEGMVMRDAIAFEEALGWEAALRKKLTAGESVRQEWVILPSEAVEITQRGSIVVRDVP